MAPFEVDRMYFTWRQDTPRKQFLSLKSAIEMHLVNLEDCVGDITRQMRVVVALVASLNALAPYFQDNPDAWPEGSTSDSPSTPSTAE